METFLERSSLTAVCEKKKRKIPKKSFLPNIYMKFLCGWFKAQYIRVVSENNWNIASCVFPVGDALSCVLFVNWFLEYLCSTVQQLLNVASGKSTMNKSWIHEWYKHFQDGRAVVKKGERAGRSGTSTTDKNLIAESLSQRGKNVQATILDYH